MKENKMKEISINNLNFFGSYLGFINYLLTLRENNNSLNKLYQEYEGIKLKAEQHNKGLEEKIKKGDYQEVISNKKIIIKNIKRIYQEFIFKWAKLNKTLSEHPKGCSLFF